LDEIYVPNSELNDLSHQENDLNPVDEDRHTDLFNQDDCGDGDGDGVSFQEPVIHGDGDGS